MGVGKCENRHWMRGERCEETLGRKIVGVGSWCHS